MGLSELFHARLGQTDDERTKDLASDAGLDVLLLERVQKPSPGVFSEDVSLIYFAIFATCIFSSCCQVIHRDVTDAVGSVWIGRSNTQSECEILNVCYYLDRRFWDVCASTEMLQCSARLRVSWKSLLRAWRSNISTLTRHSATAQTAKTAAPPWTDNLTLNSAAFLTVINPAFKGREEDFFICHIHNYTEYNQQWNVFSAFNGAHTHLEQWAADAAACGEQFGVRCLAQGSYLEPEPRFEPTTSGYKSDALFH